MVSFEPSSAAPVYVASPVPGQSAKANGTLDVTAGMAAIRAAFSPSQGEAHRGFRGEHRPSIIAGPESPTCGRMAAIVAGPADRIT
ncbi:hypothetical protein [Longimicrobium sp.]|uniref:hypothetical protein n=1 Tax=Longimicrobium sp. TaxID=2029185 RepID=UPI002E369E49|nr:hypothetical protein [Longimicrobium sp.]HEX6038362.1 hypothetical protein [Longimicrobium sp.]